MLEKIELIHQNFDSCSVQHFIFNAEVIGFTKRDFLKSQVFEFIIPPERNKDFTYYHQYMNTPLVTFIYEDYEYYASLGYQVEKNKINLLISKGFCPHNYKEHVYFDLRI